MKNWTMNQKRIITELESHRRRQALNQKIYIYPRLPFSIPQFPYTYHIVSNRICSQLRGSAFVILSFWFPNVILNYRLGGRSSSAGQWISIFSKVIFFKVILKNVLNQKFSLTEMAQWNFSFDFDHGFVDCVISWVMNSQPFAYFVSIVFIVSSLLTRIY